MTLPIDVEDGDLSHLSHHNTLHARYNNGVDILSGTLASRPAAAVVDAGTLYWSTDTDTFSRSNGTTWADISAGASAHADLTGVTANQHHNEDHAARHATGQTDALAPGDIGAATSGHNHDADYEASGAVATHAGLTDPHTGYQKESEKNVANGYAGLDANIRVPTARLASGTADATTFLRGDQTWAAPGGGGSTVVLNTATDSLTGTTTLTNAADLLFALGASETWIGEVSLFCDTSIASVTANFGFSVPSGASGYWGLSSGNTDGTSAIAGDAATFVNNISIDLETTDVRLVRMSFYVANSTTAGNFNLKFGPANASATLSLYAGSYIVARQIT